MSVGSIFRVVGGQIKRHADLIPLFGAYGIATAFTTGIIIYTSTNKADVSWNRWLNPDPYSRLDWEKNQQKLVMGIPSEKNLYKKDDHVLQLRNIIYSGDDYKREVHH